MAQKTGSFQFGSYGFFIRSRDIQNFPKEPAASGGAFNSNGILQCNGILGCNEIIPCGA